MLVDRSALSEWPYLAGVGCLTVLLFWHEPAPSSPPASGIDLVPTFSVNASQRSLQRMESNCHQKQWQTLQKGKCSDEGCAEEDRVSNARIEEPDFSLSILTCTEQANYEERSMSGGTAHNLVIEVIKTDYEF